MVQTGNIAERSGELPLTEARRIVKDLFAPNPWIYWADFLFHVSLGWAAFVAIVRLPNFSFWQLFFYVVASLALYRAVIFTHELVHLKQSTFKLFRLVWNLTCGFPLMVPSFTYRGSHMDHHKRDVYGTERDGEYLPFAVHGAHRIVFYLLLSFLLPAFLAGRFVVLTPLSYLHAKLRRLLWERASSLVVDFNYRRPPPSARDGRAWKVEEFCTFLYGSVAIFLAGAGKLSYQVLVWWYLVAVFILLLNALRTLAAHCYRDAGDYVMDISEQYLDSVNVPGNRCVTAFWAPVGLRYHATHHLFPSIPYHGLGEAHRRLSRELPDTSLYLRTVRGSLWDALRRLWIEAKQRRRFEDPVSVRGHYRG